MQLSTIRLILIPMTYEFVDGIIKQNQEAYQYLNIKASNEWPSEELFSVLPMVRESLTKKEKPSGFGPWIFVDKIDRSIVGDGGFKGGPDHNGYIDIGYGIAKSKRRNGYALEAVSELIKWGFSHPGVKAITADCLVDNTASLDLIDKLGMKKVKIEDGLVYFILENAEAK